MAAESTPADGTVDWRAAEEYMTRGDGAEEEDGDGTDAGGSETPEFREFKYRGKTVQVDAGTYEILEDLRRDARGANGRLGSEIAKYRERLARLEGVVTAREPETHEEPDIAPPDPMLATRDIVAWQRQYDAYHAARMERLQANLEKKYLGAMTQVNERVQRNVREKEWADGFYASYDHLDHPDIKPIVAQEYTAHQAEIDSLREGGDSEAAYERLAELADQRLVRLRTIGKEENTNGNSNRRPPRLESSAGPTPGKKAEDAPREFSAANWVARQRLKMQGREPRSKRE